MDRSKKIIELRYQLWTRMCVLADEAMSIADAWWESDPDLVELHYRRCGVSLDEMSNEEAITENEPQDDDNP